MPPRYNVLADVIDVRRDAPLSSDRFLVDTNVWAWDFYLRSATMPTGAAIPQVPEYVAYLEATRNAGATRSHVGISFFELAGLIEANELLAYSISVAQLGPKEYRHNLHAERARVVVEINRVWSRVEADSDLLPMPLDAVTLAAARTRLASLPVDANDLLLLAAMDAHGVTQLLSDDGDFSCVPGVTPFTANPRVLAAASAQGRLLTR